MKMYIKIVFVLSLLAYDGIGAQEGFASPKIISSQPVKKPAMVMIIPDKPEPRRSEVEEEENLASCTTPIKNMNILLQNPMPINSTLSNSSNSPAIHSQKSETLTFILPQRIFQGGEKK